MFNSVSERITQLLVKQKTIEDSQKELYRYGFNQGFTMLFNLITTLIIGCVFGMVLQSIVFLTAYIPLRSYAGGYHASTPWRCYFISVVLISVVLGAIKIMPYSFLVCGVLVGIGTVICFVLAPTEDNNKPLDATEQKVYKKRTYIILIFELCIASLSVFVSKSVFLAICMAIFTESVMLLLGRIKNTLNRSTDPKARIC